MKKYLFLAMLALAIFASIMSTSSVFARNYHTDSKSFTMLTEDNGDNGDDSGDDGDNGDGGDNADDDGDNGDDGDNSGDDDDGNGDDGEDNGDDDNGDDGDIDDGDDNGDDDIDVTSNGTGDGSGCHTPVCPLCSKILPPNDDVDSPFYTVKRINIFGTEVTDTIVKCPYCGYTSTRDGNGNMNTVTDNMKAIYGMQYWPINKFK